MILLLLLQVAFSVAQYTAVPCTGSAPKCISLAGSEENKILPENFTIAFIGDGGVTTQSWQVLALIRDEPAHAVIHSGDFDYNDNPTDWDNMITSVLGDSYPYFASIGNHDVPAWLGDQGYQQKLFARLNKIPGVMCTGEVAVNMFCHYKGLDIVFNGPGTYGDNHINHIGYTFTHNASSPWRICSWHKNQRLMQVGGKLDETGWEIYETCRSFGAIMATAHEHSYCRSYLMSNMERQEIVSTDPQDPLILDDVQGHSFVFVSGVGGRDIRWFDGDLHLNPWWASAHANNDGLLPGALFCTFNYGGQHNKTYCYFKQIDGQIRDSFTVISNLQRFPTATPGTTGTTATTAPTATTGVITTGSTGSTGTTGTSATTGTWATTGVHTTGTTAIQTTGTTAVQTTGTSGLHTTGTTASGTTGTIGTTALRTTGTGTTATRTTGTIVLQTTGTSALQTTGTTYTASTGTTAVTTEVVVSGNPNNDLSSNSHQRAVSYGAGFGIVSAILLLVGGGALIWYIQKKRKQHRREKLELDNYEKSPDDLPVSFTIE